jgi:hypothetical protein
VLLYFKLSKRLSTSASRSVRNLRPCLSQTQFPDGPEFNKVACRWVDDTALSVQYLFLAKRIRAAATAAESRIRGTHVPEEVAVARAAAAAAETVRDTHVPEEVVVAASKWSEPVSYQVAVAACCKSGRWLSLTIKYLINECDPAMRSAKYRIASLVSGFYGAECMELQPSELGPVVRPKRRRLKSPDCLADSKSTFQVGDLARLSRGRGGDEDMYAVIVDVARRVDVAAVAASIDTIRWFALGNGSTCAWHAARVHHRCRNLFPPDAPCESVGSILRLLWDQRQGTAHTAFWRDRALLSSAGVRCVGGDRDEMIVEEVVEVLKLTSKYAVTGRSASGTDWLPRRAGSRSSQSRTQWLPQGERDALRPSELLALENAGAVKRRRFVDTRAQSSRPRDLPPSLVKAIDQARIGVHGAGVQPLPMDIKGLHAQQNGSTRSVVRDAMKHWMDSVPGKAWLAEKAAMHAGDET